MMSLIPHDRTQSSALLLLSFFFCPNNSVFPGVSGAIATLLFFLMPLPALAQEELETILFNAPPLPEDKTAPAGRRDGGASRGNCENYESLTALVPVVDGTVWSVTTAARPTFWFYSPAPIGVDTPLEFIVQDESDNPLDYSRLQVSVDPGLYSYTLLDGTLSDDALLDDAFSDSPLSGSTMELPLDTPHYWTFSIYCDPASPESFVFVRGTIERIEVAGLEPFSETTERTLVNAKAYAQAGAWHDALTILAELRQVNPDDATIELVWYDLLRQIDLSNLEAIAPASIQDCCSGSSD